jgi:hypothetical protein
MTSIQPRKLTLTEIRKVLEPFTKPLTYDTITRKMTGYSSVGATKELKENNRKQVIQFLTEELSDVKMTPDPKALVELSTRLVEQYNKASIHTGTPVGILAGESISGPITQIALSSFHFAGSAKNVGSSIDIIKEILNVSPTRKHFFTELHYNQPMTFMEVYNSRIVLSGITLKDIVISSTTTSIYDYIEDIPDWVDIYEKIYDDDLDMTPYVPEIQYDENGNKVPATLKDINLAGKPMYLTGSEWMVKIKLNQTMMYMNRIKMSDIVNILVNAGPNLKILSSPINDGELLVFVDDYDITESSTVKETRTREKFIEKEFEKEFVSKSFLWFNIAFIPSFGDIYIKGVKGIGNITPQEVPLLSLVREEYKLSSLYDDDPNGLITPEILSLKNLDSLYVLILNKYRLTILGQTKQRFVDIASSIGIECMTNLFTERPDVLVVKKNDNISSSDTPLSYMRSIISQYKTRYDEWERQYRTSTVDKDTEFFSDLTLPDDYETMDNLCRLAYYVYADAEGTNLNDILKVDIINSDITICNNFHEFNRALGIEATRNLIIKEMVDTIIPQEYVDQRHIILLADYMTNRGIMTPITFLGLSHHQQGVSAQATMEKAVPVYKTASAFGAVESINTVSSSIQYGQRVTLGTGFNIDMINEKDIDLDDVKTKINVGSVDLTSLKQALSSSSAIIDNNAIKKLDSKNINPIQPKWEYSYRKQSDEGGDSVGTTQVIETTLPTLSSIIPMPIRFVPARNPLSGNLKLDVASKMLPVMERLGIVIPTQVNPINVSVMIPSFVSLIADIPLILRNVINPKGSIKMTTINDTEAVKLTTGSIFQLGSVISGKTTIPSSVNNITIGNDIKATAIPSVNVDPSGTKAPIIRRIVSLPSKATGQFVPLIKPTIGKVTEQQKKDEIVLKTEETSNDKSDQFLGVTVTPARLLSSGVKQVPFSSLIGSYTSFMPLQDIDTANFI